MRLNRPVVALLFASCLASCEKEKGGLGKETAKVVSDTNVLEEASAAAGAVVRNAGDCDAVKAALPEATKKLDEAEGKVQTVAGRETLNALRTRMKSIAETCP